MSCFNDSNRKRRVLGKTASNSKTSCTATNNKKVKRLPTKVVWLWRLEPLHFPESRLCGSLQECRTLKEDDQGFRFADELSNSLVF
jgi:hypothetical protein